MNLHAFDAMLLNERLPNLRCERGFGQELDASFDTAESASGFVERKVEASSLAGWACADVPELGELLKARENGRCLGDEHADGSAHIGVKWVRTMHYS